MFNTYIHKLGVASIFCVRLQQNIASYRKAGGNAVKWKLNSRLVPSAHIDDRELNQVWPTITFVVYDNIGSMRIAKTHLK